MFTETPEDAFVLSQETGQDVLLIFTASWCDACNAMHNDLNNNLDLLQNKIISYVDYDKRSDMVKEYKVRLIPDYMVYRNSLEIKRKVGYNSFIVFKKWLENE